MYRAHIIILPTRPSRSTPRTSGVSGSKFGRKIGRRFGCGFGRELVSPNTLYCLIFFSPSFYVTYVHVVVFRGLPSYSANEQHTFGRCQIEGVWIFSLCDSWFVLKSFLMYFPHVMLPNLYRRGEPIEQSCSLVLPHPYLTKVLPNNKYGFPVGNFIEIIAYFRSASQYAMIS